ncbi:MAG TPA: CocE/NonD family hydrolase C-terminal non-catalytic domain-containing protein [Ktedonobacteraceae bacterium]|nr:CocE/NonD family hydrolase C-terminal non-catalytic domain-containing protein [Ktedonobacteraceae bacterium]
MRSIACEPEQNFSHLALLYLQSAPIPRKGERPSINFGDDTNFFAQFECAPLSSIIRRGVPSGASINITSNLVRLWPGHPAREPDGCLRVWIDLWPTAYRFRRGHRLRLQVSSGAHPHSARNLGSGEQLATATKMRRAQQHVYHDPTHPSAIMLSVMS